MKYTLYSLFLLSVVMGFSSTEILSTNSSVELISVKKTLWKEYLSNFNSVKPPYLWYFGKYRPDDATVEEIIKNRYYSHGNVIRNNKIVESEYLNLFVPNTDDGNSYEYYYGSKYVRKQNVVATIFRKKMAEVNHFDIILAVYTKDGKMTDSRVICNADSQRRSGVLLDEIIWSDETVSKKNRIKEKYIDSECQISVYDTIMAKKSLVYMEKKQPTVFYYVSNKGKIRTESYIPLGMKINYPDQLKKICISNYYLYYNPNNKKEKQNFLKLFPSTWREIKNIYIDDSSPYYEEFAIHLETLRKVEMSISVKAYYERIIDIFLQTDDEEDFVGLTKTLEKSLLFDMNAALYPTSDNAETILSVLSKHSRADQLEFWRKVFQGEVLPDGFSSFKDTIKSLYPDMMEMLYDGRKYYEPREIEEVVVQ